MTPKITAAIVESNHRLIVEFENGDRGILDMTPFLDFGVFQALQDPARFSQVRVAFRTIEWPGGIDLDPGFVHSKCQLEIAA